MSEMLQKDHAYLAVELKTFDSCRVKLDTKDNTLGIKYLKTMFKGSDGCNVEG
jgi:hypothetical protein